MDSASQKRKPGSGFTRRACYVWLQRPSPLGFSTPVNSAPFISLWFHGNVRNAQQVAASPGGEGSARGPAAAGAPSPRACSGVHAGCGWAPFRQSAAFPLVLPQATHPPGGLPAAPSLQAAPFRLRAPGSTLAWERAAPCSLPVPSSFHFSAHPAADFPSHRLLGPCVFHHTTLN